MEISVEEAKSLLDKVQAQNNAQSRNPPPPPPAPYNVYKGE